jgi:hypothetical protein
MFAPQGTIQKNKHSLGPPMSAVEQIHFWPIIQRAHISAPKLSSPKTWPSGVATIKLNLSSRRLRVGSGGPGADAD